MHPFVPMLAVLLIASLVPVASAAGPDDACPQPAGHCVEVVLSAVDGIVEVLDEATDDLLEHYVCQDPDRLSLPFIPDCH